MMECCATSAVANISPWRLTFVSGRLALPAGSTEGDLLQCPGGGADLGQHIDAVPVVFDHTGYPAYLTLDLVQPAQVIRPASE